MNSATTVWLWFLILLSLPSYAAKPAEVFEYTPSAALCRLTLLHATFPPPPNGTDDLKRILFDPLQLAARASQGYKYITPVDAIYADFRAEAFATEYNAEAFFDLLRAARALHEESELREFLGRLTYATVELDSQLTGWRFANQPQKSLNGLMPRLVKSRDYDFQKSLPRLREAWTALDARLRLNISDWLGSIYVRQLEINSGLLLHHFPEALRHFAAKAPSNDFWNQRRLGVYVLSAFFGLPARTVVEGVSSLGSEAPRK